MTLEEGKGEYPLFLSHLINSYLYDKNAAPTLWWYLLNNKKTPHGTVHLLKKN
jgi:hypothetical protein